jgi:hypothetical protein
MEKRPSPKASTAIDSNQIILTSIEEEEEPEELPNSAANEISKKSPSAFAQTIAICASLNIAKFRFQVQEASNIQEELVRNLKERLSSGYNNEPIEVFVQ